MTLTCPCCRASNDSIACRRCKADLSLMAAVEERRAYHVTLAKRFAAEGYLDEARRYTDLARQIRPAADVRHLRAALLLLSGDCAAALRAYDETA